MFKNLTNSEGVTVLSKKQQEKVNGGGQRCVYVSGWGPGDAMANAQFFENDGPGSNTYNGGNYALTCKIRCRSTFLGIGLGQWSEIQDVPC